MSQLIQTPTFVRSWERIAHCHRSGKSEDGPRHLRLLGQSGVGKSFLLEQYAGDHPRVEGPDRVCIPVPIVPIPAAPTPKAFYRAILEALGVHIVGSQDLESLRHRAIVLLRNLHVELLLFDEVNHLLDRGKRRSHEAVSDEIKQLLDSLQIPAVFSGAVRSTQLFDTNAQLRSRVTATHTMHALNLDGRFEELRGFISTWMQRSHSPSQCDWMSSTAVATRIFYATDGMTRPLVHLLSHVPAWSKDQARSPDSFLDVLANLFRELLWEQAPPPLNPFSDKFVYRRLNRRTEPYSATVLDGDNHLDAN